MLSDFEIVGEIPTFVEGTVVDLRVDDGTHDIEQVKMSVVKIIPDDNVGQVIKGLFFFGTTEERPASVVGKHVFLLS